MNKAMIRVARSAFASVLGSFATVLMVGVLLVGAPCAGAQTPASTPATLPTYGIAIRGLPALPANFTHLPYANPDAPKGGTLDLGFHGTFDSLNSFNLRAGSTAQGLTGNVYQTLMYRSRDEPFTLYGLIAQSIETDAARDYVTFHLNPAAHFSDGSPITSRDVLFTFNLLRAKGTPQERITFGRVKAAIAPDAETVRFDLAGLNDREMPMILGLMPVLSHTTDITHFDDPSLKPLLGSGPYKVVEVNPGRRLVLERDPHYWARHLPVMQGLYNFDRINIVYYRDDASMFEAFKAGLIDYREENDPTLWMTGYDFPALREGKVFRQSLPVGGPKGMKGFVFNLRRKPFQDVRVREALSELFDFNWINKTLFYGLYTHTDSFFADSELSCISRPADARERALLAPWPGLVRPSIMAGTWHPPASSGTGYNRANEAHAFRLLQAAGYRPVNGVMTRDGKALAPEILVDGRAEERMALIYAAAMQRLGIDAHVRLVDDVQFQRRRQTFDFDMMISEWIASASPGNEQRGRWSSASADQPGSFNVAGLKSPAVDALINDMLAASTNAEFTDDVRAYDRVLLSGFYVVPLFQRAKAWIAASSRLAHPQRLPHYAKPLFGATLSNWWMKRP